MASDWLSDEYLPQPDVVEQREMGVVGRSDWRRLGLLLSRVVDDAVQPTEYVLSWRRVPGELGDALRKHHLSHRRRLFPFLHPEGSDEYVAEYLEPPALQWRNRSSVDATVIVAAAQFPE